MDRIKFVEELLAHLKDETEEKDSEPPQSSAVAPTARRGAVCAVQPIAPDKRVALGDQYVVVPPIEDAHLAKCSGVCHAKH